MWSHGGGRLSNINLVFTDKGTALKRVSVLMAELTMAVGDFMGCFEPELMSKALGEPGRQASLTCLRYRGSCACAAKKALRRTCEGCGAGVSRRTTTSLGRRSFGRLRIR